MDEEILFCETCIFGNRRESKETGFCKVRKMYKAQAMKVDKANGIKRCLKFQEG